MSVKPMHWRLSIAAMVLCAAMILLCAPQAVAADAPAPDAAAAPPVEADTATDKAAPEESKGTQAEKKWYRGSVSAGFDGWWGRKSQQNIETEQSIQFQVDPPQCERLHLRGLVWMVEQLGPAPSSYSGLQSLSNTFDAAIQVYPSYLYLDVDDVWGDSVLRIGRQRIMEGTAYNLVDGVYFKQRLNQWDWYAFAGTRGTFYEDTFENFVGGGGTSYSPTPTTKIALDAYYGQDQWHVEQQRTLHGPFAALLYGLDARPIDNQPENVALSLSLWQTVNENLTLFGRYNWYDSSGNELLLSATGYFAEPVDLTYEITYRHQFNTITDRVNDLTAYYQILDTSESFDDVLLALHRPITKNTMVSLETEFHESNRENASNRDYRRYALELSGEKLFGPAGLDGQIGVEYWSVSGQESLWTVVGEVGRRWDTFQIAQGADYQAYQDYLTTYNEPLLLLDMARVWFAPGILQGYNPLTYLYGNYAVETHQDIYTFYLRAKWAVTPDQDLNGRVTYEEDDGPYSPIWRVQADYTVRF